MKIGKLDIIREKVQPLLLWIIVPLLIGTLIAAAIPRPVVGIITLDAAIDTETARDLIAQLTYARQHPEIRAVVLVMNSPGGTVADTETVYLEILRLRAEKPVVASIGTMAASGSYYLAVGTDYIYAAPTSEVGNIGVIGYLPSAPLIYEDTISTGPYKLWGTPRDQFMRELEMIKQGFYQAVVLGRGDQLEAGPEIVLSGQIWPGSEALRLGLIDALGTQTDAIEKAAALAHIGHYATADVRSLAGIDPFTSTFFYQTAEGLTLPYPGEPGIYLLYVPPLPPEAQP
jgi:protease-4